MKKLSSLLLFTFIGISIFAQKTKIGIQIGTNDTTFKRNIPSKNSFKLGFLVGANFEYAVSNKVSLKSGIYYEQRNEKLLNNNFILPGEYPDNYSPTETVNYHNIDIPLLAKFNLTQSKHFFLNSGFTLNYLIRPIINGKNSNKLDLNFSIGAGTAFKLKNNDLNIELRYNPYLFNIARNYPNDDLKMTPLNLIVFWNFDL